MQALKVGVVGLGMRGFWIALQVQECAEMELVALADFSEEMRKIAEEKFPGITIYNSGETLANAPEVEAVVITTGDRFHADNAKEALRAGKHVLIEKPMAQSFEDLEEIARLQKEKNVTVGTFLELRVSTLFGRAKEIIDSGEIGKVLAGNCLDHVGRDHSQFYARARTRAKEYVVSLVLQKGVHSLDLLNWYMSGSPAQVAAVGQLAHFGGDRDPQLHCIDCAERETCPHVHDPVWRLGEPLNIDLKAGDDLCVWSSACDVEDVSFLTIRMGDGRVAAYQEVHFSAFYGIHFTIYGDEGQLDLEANHDTGDAWIQVTKRITREVRKEKPSEDTGHGNADAYLLTDFAKAVQEGREPTANLRAGFESAAIAIAARKSIDTGAFVDLPVWDTVPF